MDSKSRERTRNSEPLRPHQVGQTALQRESDARLRDKVRHLIKSEGYSLEGVFAAGRAKAPRAPGTVPPKFRNPANPEQTWTGRGKRPHWFSDALKAGKQPQDLAI